MPQFSYRLVVGDDDNQTQQCMAFWYDREFAVFDHEADASSQALDALVFGVCRQPKNLLAHLRRIYYCYRTQRRDQLFAALLDFLIVLQGRGQALSRRVLKGSRAELNKNDYMKLTQATSGDLVKLGNRYSVFSTGVLGRHELVRQGRQHQTQVDAMILANDFIEYSQLDQAIDVLEVALQAQPERLDMQETLLQLYKSTGESERFRAFYQLLNATGAILADEWRETALYFAGRAT